MAGSRLGLLVLSGRCPVCWLFRLACHMTGENLRPAWSSEIVEIYRTSESWIWIEDCVVQYSIFNLGSRLLLAASPHRQVSCWLYWWTCTRTGENLRSASLSNPTQSAAELVGLRNPENGTHACVIQFSRQSIGLQFCLSSSPHFSFTRYP